MKPGGTLATPVGHLADGTAHYVPIGAIEIDESGVRCHLCGQWFLSLAPHLRVHGLDRAAYVEQFGLELTCVLEAPLTRKRRAAALADRWDNEPSLRLASAAAAARARSGELARSAARANRGRAHPAQRLVKTMASLATIDPAAQARANRTRASAEVRQTGYDAVAARGFDDVSSYVLQGLSAGRSLASLSVAVGLNKDWLSRHIDELIADQAWRERLGARPDDPRWAAFLPGTPFRSIEDYLWLRHVQDGRSLAAIALECGLGRVAVRSAMARYDVPLRLRVTSRGRGRSRLEPPRRGSSDQVADSARREVGTR